MSEYGLVETHVREPKGKFAGNAEVNRGIESVPENTVVVELQLMKKDGAGGVVPIEAVDAASLAYCIATHGVTTGAGETSPLTVYYTGEFIGTRLVYPEAKSAEDYKAALVDRQIYLR